MSIDPFLTAALEDALPIDWACAPVTVGGHFWIGVGEEDVRTLGIVGVPSAENAGARPPGYSSRSPRADLSIAPIAQGEGMPEHGLEQAWEAHRLARGRLQ